MPGGGGATPQSSTQTTFQNTGPPAFLQPFLQLGEQNLADTFYGIPDNTPAAPAYYPGNTVAYNSPQTNTALSNLFNYGANPQFTPTGASATWQGDVLSNPNFTNPTSNPDFQRALQAGFQPQTNQFVNQVLPTIQGNFEGAGRYGSGANMEADKLAMDSLNQSQANAAATAGSSFYTNALGIQQNAANMGPQLTQAELGLIGAQGQAGAGIDQANQAQIDANIARYNYDQNAPFYNIARYLSTANAGYPGSNSTGQIYGAAQPASNPTASIFGAGLGLAGLGLNAASVFGFSDERLKKNVRRVGATDEGLPLYEFAYKGDPLSARHIGLMAQDVELVKPDAVATHPSGYKMVNYEAALPVGGLF